MMDEATRELLSRHLDGDLDPAEAVRLRGLIEADPLLARELEEMSRLRDALRELARLEEPPEALDRRVAPLLRAPARRRVARSFVPWLAAAATLVLGVFVALLVDRSAGGPAPTGTIVQRKAELPATGRVGTDELLAPPASSTEEERAQAVSPPQLSAPVREVQPREVLREVAEAKPAPKEIGKGAKVPAQAERRDELAFAPAPVLPPPEADAAAQAEPFEQKRDSEDVDGFMVGAEAGVPSGSATAQRSRQPTGAAVAGALRLLSEPSRTWQVAVPRALPEGEYRMVLTVKGEVVVSCRTDSDQSQSVDSSRACGSVVGQALPGAAEGDRPALLTVRQPGPAP